MKAKKLLAASICIMLFVISVCAGCSNVDDKTPSLSDVAEQSADSSESEVTEDNLSELPTEISYSEAWGDVEIKQITPTNEQVYYSISDNGELLFGEIIDNSDASNMEDFNFDNNLFVENSDTGDKELIKKVQAPIQVWDADINSDWVIWVEGIVNEGITCKKFEMYSYNRNTKEINLFFETPIDENGNKIDNHQPKPQLKDDRVLLDVIVGIDEENNSAYLIESREYDLTAGNYVKISDQFAFPQWADNGYIGLEQDKSNRDYSIFYNISDGVYTALMENGAYVYDYITDGNAIAVTAQRYETDDPSNESMLANLWLIENGTEKQLVNVTDENPSGCGWPTISEKFITWSRGSQAYAYDREQNVIINLSNEFGDSYAPITNDKYLIWRTPSEKDIEEKTMICSVLNIVEVEDLP